MFNDGFHLTKCFDFYARGSDFLEAKNGSLQWENLGNLLLKQIPNFLKKSHVCYFAVLSKKYLVSLLYLHFIYILCKVF